MTFCIIKMNSMCSMKKVQFLEIKFIFEFPEKVLMFLHLCYSHHTTLGCNNLEKLLSIFGQRQTNSCWAKGTFINDVTQ